MFHEIWVYLSCINKITGYLNTSHHQIFSYIFSIDVLKSIICDLRLHSHNKSSKGGFHTIINSWKLNIYISCPMWFMGLSWTYLKWNFSLPQNSQVRFWQDHIIPCRGDDGYFLKMARRNRSACGMPAAGQRWLSGYRQRYDRLQQPKHQFEHGV